VRWLDGPRRAFTVNIAQPASVPNGNDVKPRNVNYVYGGPTNPVSPDPEQVTALTNVADSTPYATFAYDAAGNQTQRVIGDVAWLYLYDGEDRLRRVTKKSATTPMLVYSIEEYWYDENGSRIGVLKRDGAGVAQELIWFIGDTEAHYTAAGVVSKVLSHLSLGTPVARVERTGNTTTAIEYQFHGMASNTIAAVAADGTVNANVVYAPYGEVLEAQEAGGNGSVFGLAGHRRRFNDKYVDEIGGLGYYGARYYDNVLIGWTQADPKYQVAPDAAGKSPRRRNLYSFVLENPLRYMDPDGQEGLNIAIVDYVKRPEMRDGANMAIAGARTALGNMGKLGSVIAPILKKYNITMTVTVVRGGQAIPAGTNYQIAIVDTGDKRSIAAADADHKKDSVAPNGDHVKTGGAVYNLIRSAHEKPGVVAGGIAELGGDLSLIFADVIQDTIDKRGNDAARDQAEHHGAHEPAHSFTVCHGDGAPGNSCTQKHGKNDIMNRDWLGGNGQVNWTNEDLGKIDGYFGSYSRTHRTGAGTGQGCTSGNAECL